MLYETTFIPAGVVKQLIVFPFIGESTPVIPVPVLPVAFFQTLDWQREVQHGDSADAIPDTFIEQEP